MNYTNGKIYKIWNDVNDEVYIGSTCRTLIKRFADHLYCVRRKDRMHRPLYKLMNELGIAHFQIELMIDAPCEDKEQLLKVEGEYIRNYATLNTRITDRNKREYYQDKKEHIRQVVR